MSRASTLEAEIAAQISSVQTRRLAKTA
jgi:hypothetical protein